MAEQVTVDREADTVCNTQGNCETLTAKKSLHACDSFTSLRHMTNWHTIKEGSEENNLSLAVKRMQTVCLVLLDLRVYL